MIVFVSISERHLSIETCMTTFFSFFFLLAWRKSHTQTYLPNVCFYFHFCTHLGLVGFNSCFVFIIVLLEILLLLLLFYCYYCYCCYYFDVSMCMWLSALYFTFNIHVTSTGSNVNEFFSEKKIRTDSLCVYFCFPFRLVFTYFFCFTLLSRFSYCSYCVVFYVWV